MKKYLIFLFLSIITIILLLFAAHKIPKVEYTLQPNIELDIQGAFTTTLTDITVKKFNNNVLDVVFVFGYYGGNRLNDKPELHLIRFEPNNLGGYKSGIEQNINEE